MSPPELRAASIRTSRVAMPLVALGGVSQVKESVRDARGVRALEDLGGDIRHAFRLLRASPMFAATVIVVLGGALGAAIAVFAVADSSLLSDRRYGVSDRLVRIYQTNSPTNRWSLSSVDALALIDEQRSFDAIGFCSASRPGTCRHGRARACRRCLGVRRDSLPLSR